MTTNYGHHLENNLAEYPLCFLALPPYFAEQLIALSAVLWQKVENHFFVLKEILIYKKIDRKNVTKLATQQFTHPPDSVILMLNLEKSICASPLSYICIYKLNRLITVSLAAIRRTGRAVSLEC